MNQRRHYLMRTLVILAAGAALGLGGHYLTERPAYAGDDRPKPPEQALHVANQLSAAFEYAADAVRPSVVSIQATRHIKPTMNFRAPMPNGDDHWPFGEQFLRRFFEDQVPSLPFTQQGLGSGLIVDRAGYILTNNHVVDGAEELAVKLHDGRELPAKVVGRDPASDLAVIKITTDNLRPAELGDSEQLRVGEWVLAVGDPFGLNDTITCGIVSAKGRANVHIAQYENFIQTDAAINPGNSGGPLVDLNGRVVGINTAIASRTGGNMGVGFAIPVNMAKNIMKSLIGQGHVTRGWLGIAIQALDPGLAKSFKYGSTKGALIGDVQSGSPADRAGLKPGDIITVYQGKEVAGPAELRNEVASTKPGTKAELTIRRDGSEKTLAVKVGELKEQLVGPAQEFNASKELGLSVENLSPAQAQELGYTGDEAGVLITAVEPGGLAAEAGLQANDIIVSVQDRPVANVAQFQNELSRHDLKEGVRLSIQSGTMKRFVFLRENGG